MTLAPRPNPSVRQVTTPSLGHRRREALPAVRSCRMGQAFAAAAHRA